MKLNRLLALAATAAMAASPAFAAPFTIDFEKNWDYGTDVNGYYNGGTASDGTTGPNFGISFTGVSGLSNDPFFTYYDNAPSMLGTAYAYAFGPGDTAFMNVGKGVASTLSLYYSSPSDASGAVKAYSGPNGTGALLGSFDLEASSGGGYDTWTAVTLTFSGIARSFDLTGSAYVVAFDNISGDTVPELDAAGATGALAFLAGILSLASERRPRTRPAD